jgi:nucleotide-binding universal stress UspA family protein
MSKRSLDQIPLHDQRVVVGVDTSAGAADALRWADQFAARTGRRLRVVTSWSYPATAALPGGPQLRSVEAMDAATFEEISQLVVSEIGRSIDEADFFVHRGPADLALLSAAEAEDAALVVVGKRGLGPIDGRLLGSISRRVAELADCPVAVIPAVTGIGAAPPAEGPILVGIDGSSAAADARKWAVRSATELDVGLVFAHGVAGLPSELPPASVDRFLDRARFMVESHVEAAGLEGRSAGAEVAVEDPRRFLERVAQDHGAQMIVLGASGEGPVGGLLVGTVVHYVAQFSHLPVIIVR